MFEQQEISIGNLLLDLKNFRHGEKSGQKAARDAIIAEQGKKLVRLAKDIVTHGLNPFDLPMVVDAKDELGNYVVVEGNRRLTAITLMLDPDLAQGTPLHRDFVKLAKEHSDSVPRVMTCVIAPDRASARVWIDRKHANGLEGSGTEHWSAMAKARADVDAGIPRPDLDVVNFALTNTDLDADLREQLEDGDFNLTTLQRLVTTRELQEKAGFDLIDGKLIGTSNQDWTLRVLTDLVATIAQGKRNNIKFTERSIDSQEKRQEFIDTLVDDHSGKRKAKGWSISGNPKAVSVAKKAVAAAKPARQTASTADQPNLIPKKFRLALPPGKVNDIFVELKKLDVITYRHSVSVLLRVFLELSLDDYVTKHGIALPKDGKGKPVDTLSVRLSHVVTHVKKSKLMDGKEIKPIDVAIAQKDSLLAPDTLNAYVHSSWMNPDPLQLKLAWANCQLFLERLWSSENNAGQK